MPADKEPLVNLDELARLLEAHEGPSGPRHKPEPRPSRSGLRTTGAVAAGALAAGSALGFGVGSSLTSAESAQASYVGSGFLPARGWSVVQTGDVDRGRSTRAIATNVALRFADLAQGVPRATLESLPPRGVIIVATFATRGDADVDARFPVRPLPLRLSDAQQVSPTERRLEAAVNGTNVVVRIFAGGSRQWPESEVVAARQLSRLVVGADQVTIFARPTIIEAQDPWTTLFGSIDSGKAGETVTIQAKDCGSSFFRVVDGTTTRDGGGWSTEYSPGISTTLRAVWNEKASNQVSVRQRPWVTLLREARNAFSIRVGSTPRGGMPGGPQTTFWGKRAAFQRFDSQRRTWLTLKRVVLAEDSVKFRVSVPKGTLVRAVLPLSQARPCYLAGVSFTQRV